MSEVIVSRTKKAKRPKAAAPHVMMGEPVKVRLGDLKFDERNPRDISVGEMSALKRSIAQYGFVEPVVVRKENNLIIGGHQRATALLELLREQDRSEGDIAAYEVTAVVCDLTDAQAKGLNVALNRIHGEWDYDKLSSLFQSFTPDLDYAELDFSGFSTDEISDIIALTAADQPALTRHVEFDADLAGSARKFHFEVATDAEATTCRRALAAYGMTGPGDAGGALAAALAAALAHKRCKKPAVEKVGKAAPKKKRNR